MPRKGLLEIKCPFKYKSTLKGYLGDKNSPLDVDKKIKENHQYYFQIQQQLLVAEKQYCDLYIWSQGKEDNDKILIRVEKNETFCVNLLQKLKKVFINVVLKK